MNHLNHLIPAAAAELDRPVEERISRLRRPFWIGYTRAQTILEKIEHLLGHPGTHRMPSLLLAGDTNNGKTMLIRRFVEMHPAERGDLGISRKVLLIQAPPVPDERRLYFAILDALQAPYSPSGLTAAKMMLSWWAPASKTRCAPSRPILNWPIVLSLSHSHAGLWTVSFACCS